MPIAFLTAESNLANLQASESQHMKLAIRPRLARRDEKLNEQLVPRFDPWANMGQQTMDSAALGTNRRSRGTPGHRYDRRETGRREMNQVTCCVFDLETTNLFADFGVLLCGVVKPAYGRAKVFRADDLNPHWPSRRSDDSAAIVAELSHYDIWGAHNGQKFDVPFLRTRLLAHGMDPLPAKKLIDPVLLARNKLRLSFNSLSQVATLLNVNSKTTVEPQQWLPAALEAMRCIVERCVQDVLVLKKVIGALKAYSATYNTYGSGF